MPSGVNAAEIGKSAEIDAFKDRAVGDQNCRAGIFQLVANLALAIRGVEQRRNSSRKRCGMIGDAEFPRVGQKDGDDVSGLNAGGDQTLCGALDQFTILTVGEAAAARGIDYGSLSRVAAA